MLHAEDVKPAVLVHLGFPAGWPASRRKGKLWAVRAAILGRSRTRNQWSASSAIVLIVATWPVLLGHAGWLDAGLCRFRQGPPQLYTRRHHSTGGRDTCEPC